MSNFPEESIYANESRRGAATETEIKWEQEVQYTGCLREIEEPAFVLDPK